jgi:hypothetical protein
MSPHHWNATCLLPFPNATECSRKKLNVTNPPIITVVGKAFWDFGDAPKGPRQQAKVHAGLLGLGDFMQR